MAKSKTTVKSTTGRKANTRARADQRMREIQAREPAHPRATRDFEGLNKVARLMSGVAHRAAGAYADNDLNEGYKFVRLAKAGYNEAMGIVEFIIKGKRVLSEPEREKLITTMNQIKLLRIRVEDYVQASKDETWRRHNVEDWTPHPLGEDKQGFFARERF